MKLSYERDMSHNYMIPEAENAEEAQNWQIQMLTENQIGGLLRCTVKTINCRNRYCYDITSRQSMAQLYETQPMQIGEIRKLLSCLYRTLREIENYLLDAARIVLDPRCIYLDVETGEAWFCYLPEYHADPEEAFRKLTSWFLCHLDQQDSASVLQGYELYRKAREQQSSMQELLRFGMAFSEEDSGTRNRSSSQADEEYGRQAGQRSVTLCQDSEPARKRIGQNEDSRRSKTGKKPDEKQGAALAEHRQPSPPEPVKQKRHVLVLSVAVLLVITAAVAVGVWLGILTATQAGEILILAAGLAAYLLSVQKKRRKEEQSGQGKQAYQREQKAERGRKKREKKALRRQKRSGSRRERKDEETIERKAETQNLGVPDQSSRELAGRGTAVPQSREEPQVLSAAEDPIGATTLLWEGTEEYEPRLTLLSMNSRDRQSVVLMNDSYLVGKLKSKADIRIDDPAVSRMHARIQKEGEAYYLQDLNSTNGTFVNGRRLDVQEKVRIQEGDEITFAETGYYVGKC